MGIRQYLRRSKFRLAHEITDRAARNGWNPLDAVRAAIQSECGFPPFDHENVTDYTARGAGVSRDALDRYREAMSRGESPSTEQARIHAFMDAIGTRIAGL